MHLGEVLKGLPLLEARRARQAVHRGLQSLNLETMSLSMASWYIM